MSTRSAVCLEISARYSLDRVRGLDHRFEPAVGDPEIPLLQEGGGRLGGGLLVEVLEGQPDLIGARGLQMMGRQAVFIYFSFCYPLLWIAGLQTVCKFCSR